MRPRVNPLVTMGQNNGFKNFQAGAQHRKTLEHFVSSRIFILVEVRPKTHRPQQHVSLIASWWQIHRALLSGPLNLKSCYVSDEPTFPPSPALTLALPSLSLQLSCARLVWGDCALHSAIGLTSPLSKYGTSMEVL